MKPGITARGPSYHKDAKRSDIYTPAPLAQFLFDLLANQGFTTVLDPAIGAGALTKPWHATGRTIIGCDINSTSADCADIFIPGPFEGIKEWSTLTPDLVLCNAPFNGSSGSKLYPEVFLRHLVQLFGKELPVVLFCPMGFRLNQRLRSPRYSWLRDNGPLITDIIALPLDIFPHVQFHMELILFNLSNIEQHNFLPQRYVSQMLQEEVYVNTRTGLYYLNKGKNRQLLKHEQVMTESAAIEAGFHYRHER